LPSSIHITYEKYLDSDIETIIASKQIKPIEIYHYPPQGESKTPDDRIENLLRQNLDNFDSFKDFNNIQTYTDFNRLQIYKSSRHSLKRHSNESPETHVSFNSLSKRSSRS